jgi:hypothetical protein
LALNVVIGLVAACVIIIAGCTSDVGSVPSDKEARDNYLAKEAESAANTKSKRPAPKSIKSKLANRPAEASN